MPITEHTINDVLADLLRETRCAWRDSNSVCSENTGMLKGTNERPDILIIENLVSPVTIETEIFPATTVESDAISRIGKQIRDTGNVILSSVAVRMPMRFKMEHGAKLRIEIANANDMEMALFSGSNPSKYSRWPRSGWILGSISDLSVLTQAASVPPHIIDAAADQLVNGVTEAAGLLAEMVKAHSGAIHNISNELRQEDGEQTRRMAATIIANALVFQEVLAGGPGELSKVLSLDQLRGNKTLNKSAILAEWRKILKVNYWPIFDIARRILEMIPASASKFLIESLSITADRLVQSQLMRSHDLTGAVFQRVIADRKFLAAYYTTPASAALLAGLVVSPDDPIVGGNWSNANRIADLRIADFACGTGTLLSTTYQRISQLHELAGGDAEIIHPKMMATSLVGCDVLPAAAHLTASMLAGAHPTRKYDQSSIYTVGYGRQQDGSIALGSLDLLDPIGKLPLLDITAKAASGSGESEKDTWFSLPDKSFDIVIMNPPFTRDVGHEGKKIGIPNPMFAAFQASEQDQRLMATFLDKLIKGTSAHGNAGEASIFLALADRKLKPGGIMGMVMPLSLLSGEAWEKSRVLLSKKYNNIILASIAGVEGSDIAFSADTGMGDCLVIGRKDEETPIARKINVNKKRAVFIILNKRPSYPLLGASIANQVRQLISKKGIRRLEEGPVGGTPINFGDETVGHLIDAPIGNSGGWGISRISDLSLAQTAYQLGVERRIWLPSMHKSEVEIIPITTVDKIGNIGPYHADINGNTSSGGIRGPFDIVPIKSHIMPTYPVLWSHDAVKERTLSFEADCEGLPRSGSNASEEEIISQKVANVWKSASHCHFNRDFRFNSQSTAMQYSPRPTIGGRAWPSIKLSSIAEEKALVLWANTTLGLLLYWWHANKQQDGRGSIGITTLQNLYVLDTTKLTKKQLAESVSLFDALNDKPLLPFNDILKDTNRKTLDELFIRDVLRIKSLFFTSNGPMALIRMKLGREPSICGHKSSKNL